MEGVRVEKFYLYLPLLKLVKYQKALFGQSVSTNFDVDCRFKQF